VYGDSLKNNVVAILVLDEPVLTAWATKFNVAYAVAKDLCSAPQVREAV
jgi:hypothetical protein